MEVVTKGVGDWLGLVVVVHTSKISPALVATEFDQPLIVKEIAPSPICRYKVHTHISNYHNASLRLQYYKLGEIRCITFHTYRLLAV